MDRNRRPEFDAPQGLLNIEDCVDGSGQVGLPAGTTLISLIDRNIACVGDAVAYRYLDFGRDAGGRAADLTWTQFGSRLRAIGAGIQQVASHGDRVAILAPQGLDYISGFFGAIKAGTIAVPLFAPELPGHAARLETALDDARPTVVLTTAAAAAAVAAFLDKLSGTRPQVLVIDDIADSAGDCFDDIVIGEDDVSHIQYTSGATRPPIGVEITQRAVGTNLLQMIFSIDLLDRDTHGVSWLPLYHDMGLSMIGFPAMYGGHSTLMSPTAFVRRPLRWIQALSAESQAGRVVTAAPNFAYEWTAQRGLPTPGEDIDLSNAVMIIGSEPVSFAAITSFTKAFTPYGLQPTAIKPSYGIAEATLFVSTIAPTAQAKVAYFDNRLLAAGRAVRVANDDPNAGAQVSCGQVARSQWAVIVSPGDKAELPDGEVGEIWLHGNNIGRGYWGQPEETRLRFGARLVSRLAIGSHADGVPTAAAWLRTGDLGTHLDGQLYVIGRIADLLTIDGSNFYPQEIEATAADAATLVRRGYVAAFTTPAQSASAREELVIIAERAPGTRGSDPQPAMSAIRDAVLQRYGLAVRDIRVLPAGAIPRTTSGKLARRACRAEYLDGALGGPAGCLR